MGSFKENECQAIVAHICTLKHKLRLRISHLISQLNLHFGIKYGPQQVSQVMLVVKNPPANAGDIETWVWSLGREDPLEEDVVTHSSILAWRIPQREGPGRLQRLKKCFKKLDTTERLSMHTHGPQWHKECKDTLLYMIRQKLGGNIYYDENVWVSATQVNSTKDLKTLSVTYRIIDSSPQDPYFNF